jgi:hypothetical protein
MPREPNVQGQAGAPRGAPVLPGSPLHRLLQIIAREIVKDRDRRSPGGHAATSEKK